MIDWGQSKSAIGVKVLPQLQRDRKWGIPWHICTRFDGRTLAELIYYIGNIVSHVFERVNDIDVCGHVVKFIIVQVTGPTWIYNNLALVWEIDDMVCVVTMV